MFFLFCLTLSIVCGLLFTGFISFFSRVLRLIYLIGSLLSLKFFLVMLFLTSGLDMVSGLFFSGFFIKLEVLRVSLEYNLSGFSVLLVLLAMFLWCLCVLASWFTKYHFNYLQVILLLINFLLIQTFLVSDFLFFYIFFEALLLPLVVLIGVGGSRDRKVSAAYQLFLFTFFGSIFILLSLLVFYSHFGLVRDFHGMGVSLSSSRQIVFWFAFFIGVLVKVPMYPLHTGLPEAHVEAPTVGSVILAGIILKLGPYAVVRFLVNTFDGGSFVYSDKVQLFAAIVILLASLATCVQVDMKKIVAYSSIAHMNYALLGIFAFQPEGFLGMTILMLAHGIVSPALFLSIGFIYERYKTRLLVRYGGLFRKMPMLGSIQFIFILANMGFPGTFSFGGEFFTLMGSFFRNTLVCFVAGSGVLMSAVYSLMLYTSLFFNQVFNFYVDFGVKSGLSGIFVYNKLAFDINVRISNLKSLCESGVPFVYFMDFRESSYRYFGDLSHREFFLLMSNLILVILLGLFPGGLMILIDNFDLISLQLN